MQPAWCQRRACLLAVAALSLPAPVVSQRNVSLASPIAPMGVTMEKVVEHGWETGEVLGGKREGQWSKRVQQRSAAVTAEVVIIGGWT